MRKNFKLSLTMATLAERNANDAMVGTSAGVWSRAVFLCLWAWQEFGFSRREDVFTIGLFIKKLYT
jgi:hypothetical protein